jgi:hippurate hydrolase
VTGLVGRLKRGGGTRAIGIRADMDALPIEENGPGLPQRAAGHHARLRPRRPHGDAAGAAKYLAQHGEFSAR